MRFITPILLALFITACSPVITSSTKASNTILNYKMKETLRAWQTATIAPQADYEFYEANSTYLDDGLRYHYALLKNIASIGILEQITGEPVFASGPHQNGTLDFYAMDRFGYYNPDFLERVEEVLEYSLQNDGLFKQLGKYIYDQKLGKMVDTYYESYRYLNDNPDITAQVKKDYSAAITNNTQAGEVLQNAFSPFANSKEELGQDWYIANTAPGFWIRRQMDGTADEFFELLEMVRTAYE